MGSTVPNTLKFYLKSKYVITKATKAGVFCHFNLRWKRSDTLTLGNLAHFRHLFTTG